MKLLFVGQAPSRETDGKPPFVGKCGKFLADLLGTTQDQMLVDHDFVNVLDKWPGKGIGGDKFPLIEAKVSARKMLEKFRGRVVILLGNNVARAFDFGNFRYYEWYEIHKSENFADVVASFVTVVPHPSGVNHHWNKPYNREFAKRFLGELAKMERIDAKLKQADRQDVPLA